MHLRYIGLTLVCLLGACADAAPAQQAQAHASVALPPAAERVLRDYETAWRAHDAAALAALFHPEGFVLSSGAPPVRGRAAIQKHYAGQGGSLHLRAIEYAAQDTIGYIIGMFGGSANQDSGKFVLALRRSNASQPWLIAADMDNHIKR